MTKHPLELAPHPNKILCQMEKEEGILTVQQKHKMMRKNHNHNIQKCNILIGIKLKDIQVIDKKKTMEAVVHLNGGQKKQVG